MEDPLQPYIFVCLNKKVEHHHNWFLFTTYNKTIITLSEVFFIFLFFIYFLIFLFFFHIGTVPKSNRKIVEIGKIETYTVWFNFQTYIIFSILSNFEIQWDRYIVWLSLASRRLYNILYFLWLYNEFFIILYNILTIAELDLLSNYNIKYICTIYTRIYTCLACIPRFALREKVTLRLLKLLFLGSGCSRVV